MTKCGQLAIILVIAAAAPVLADDADRKSEPPLGLAEVVDPDENPTTNAKVALGKRLFFDPILSRDGKIACMTCHDPMKAFAQPGVELSEGIDGKRGRRNAPSLLNVGFASSLFHDGRAATLEEQAWQPILADDEMGNHSEQEVLDRLNTSADYPTLFAAAFGTEQATKANVAQALASFQRTLLAGDAPFDRWNWGDSDSLGDEASKGYGLFAGRALCWQCHPLNNIDDGALLFTDDQFHNTGVSSLRGEAGTSDLGRMEVTGDKRDRWKFRTPSLRNVALTAPYMHDGSIKTLREVVEFYNDAKGKGELLPLNLDDDEITALVAFLEALTTTPSKPEPTQSD